MCCSLALPTILGALFSVTVLAQRPGEAAAERPLADGQVVDVLGDVVPAAAVRAEQGGRVVGRTSSDGDGRFRLRLPATGAELVVGARGKAVVRVPWRGAIRSPVERIVLQDAADLRGRVFDVEGAPVAGARVLATAPGFRADTTTAADGSYLLPGLPLRGLNLFALAGAGRTERRLHLAADADLDLTLAGTAGRALVLVSGLPADRLATAQLRVFGPDAAAVIDGGRMPLRPDATAEFRLRASCLGTLDAPGYRTRPDTLWLMPHSRQELAAEPIGQSEITGTLRGLDGRPGVGLHVALCDRSGFALATAIGGTDGRFRLTSDLPMRELAKAGSRIGIRLGAGALIADGERQFRDGYCWVTCNPRQPIAISTEPAAAVRQRLVDDQGQALAFAEVTVVDDRDEDSHLPLLTAWTDGDGRLELDLPPGPLRLLAVGPSGTVLCARWQARIGVDTPAWQPVRCGQVEGVLLDGAGAPAPGVEILVASVDLQVGGNDAAVRQRAVVRSDRLGRFRCRGLPIGDWTLATLDTAEPANATFAAREGETTRVELRLPR